MARKITTADLPAATEGGSIRVGGFHGKPVTVISLEITGASGSFAVDGDKRVYRLCSTCRNSSGFRPEYAGVLGGQCFHCNGTGVYPYADTVELAQRKVRAAVKRAATTARKAQERAAARAVEISAWQEANAEIMAQIKECAALVDADARTSRDEDLIIDFADRVTLTDPQIELAKAAMERIAAARAAKAQKVAAARYGAEVNEKTTITGVIAVAMVVEGDYGSSRMIVVEGAGECAGITAKWTGTANAIWGLQKGETVTLTGTVKKHAEYQGIPQTVLTRCKVS